MPATAQRGALVRGAGAVGCGQYLQDMKEDRLTAQYSAQYYQWVAGYLSAYGFYSDKPALSTIPDQATINAYLEKHCRDRPLDTLTRAVMFLIGDIGGYKPK